MFLLVALTGFVVSSLAQYVPAAEPSYADPSPYVAPPAYGAAPAYGYAHGHSHGHGHGRYSSSSSGEHHHHHCNKCHDLRTTCAGFDDTETGTCSPAKISYVHVHGCKIAVARCGNGLFQLITKKDKTLLAEGKNFERLAKCTRKGKWSSNAVKEEEAFFKTVYCFQPNATP